MKIKRMTSATGITVYRGCVELTEDIVIRLQSEKKARQFVKFYSATSQLSLYKKPSTKVNRFTLDDKDMGIITRFDFQTLIKYQQNQNEQHNQQQSKSKNSESPCVLASQPVPLSIDADTVQTQRKVICEVLPETSQRISSDRQERSTGTALAELVSAMAQYSESRDGEHRFIMQLEQFNRGLEARERSECEVEREEAALQRTILEVAIRQREIGIEIDLSTAQIEHRTEQTEKRIAKINREIAEIDRETAEIDRETERERAEINRTLAQSRANLRVRQRRAEIRARERARKNSLSVC